MTNWLDFTKTIITLSLMASESMAHPAFGLMGYWLTALGGAYKAKQNRCPELGVLPSFRLRFFWKYKNIPVLMILKVRKHFMVFKQRDLAWSGLL